MRYLIKALTTCSIALAAAAPAAADEIQFCFLFCSVKRAPALDSFCSAYQQANRSPADAAELKKLPRPLKLRLTANDVLYLCKCKGWTDPICDGK